MTVFLGSAVFYNTKLNDIQLEGANLEDASFYQTPLKHCDISQAFFKSIQVNKEDLFGCKVSREQALQFAILMGLEIID